MFYNSKGAKNESDKEVAAFLEYLIDGQPRTDFLTQMEREVREVKQNLMWRKEYMTFEMMQPGQTITFGKYEWRVLCTQDDKALLITEYILKTQPYHDTYEDITWADCSLRKFLNNEFYNEFSETDKARIIPTVNKTANNEWYGTDGGVDTQDYVFLLSIEEAACQYFGDSSSLLYSSRKNKRYWFERKDENNSKRSASFKGDDWFSWWWLRSPGRVGVKAAYIHGNGDIGIQGNNVLKGNIADGFCTGGVRPAVWIRNDILTAASR